MFHCNRLTTVEAIQDYASVICWHIVEVNHHHHVEQWHTALLNKTVLR